MIKQNNIFIVATILLLVAFVGNSQTSLDTNVPSIYGTDNCGFGDQALNTTGSGSANTALGYNVLNSNASGAQNSAAGANALMLNTSGSDNTAIGAFALSNNDALGNQGDRNVSVGAMSLLNNTDGDENTAAGADALNSNTKGSYNTALGHSALFNNSELSGAYGINNSAAGYRALFNNIEAVENTAFGFEALFENQHGEKNTAIGANALKNNDQVAGVYGCRNTSAGYNSLFGNVESWYSTAIGQEALFNSNNWYNDATGYRALFTNATGYNNVAAGTESSFSNLSGYGNVAFGYQALYANTGNYNVAVGSSAHLNDAAATEYNTCLGYASLAYATPGDKNTLFGSNTDMNGNYSNSSAMGEGTMLTASNQIRLGNSTVTKVGGQVAYSTSSDARFKFNIESKDVIGLDFIMRLRPVVYNFDAKSLEKHLVKNLPDAVQKSRITADFSKISEIRQSGFIAQEVEQAAISSGFNFNGVSSPKSESDFYKLSYDLFVVPIIKAIQEQQVLIRNQKQKTEVLISKIDKQNKAIEQLKNEGIGFESTALSKDIKLSIINSESQKIIVQYTIPVEFINPSLMVCNSAGEKIKSYALAVNESSSKLELSELTSGSHYFCILSGGQVLAFQRINVK